MNCDEGATVPAIAGPTSVTASSPYAGYLYSYPHKTAYRPLTPRVPLAPLWAGEDRSALSLYLHVPFCEMRCGFCNLFTRSRPPGERVEAWLATLRRQASVVRALLGPVHVDRFAVGGGTPTMLDPSQLDSVFELLGSFGVLGQPSSVETSPATATPDRLAVLKQAQVTRVSIGVQSFDTEEVAAAQRPQSSQQVQTALDAIRAVGFPVLNLDLIYGIPGQTADSWLRSLRAALAWRPEELYLYPLYVRPLTGMAARAKTADDALRMELYTVGRDYLRSEGYEQASMRMFRRVASPADRPQGEQGKQAEPGKLGQHGEREQAPAYRCQEDGMIGLGVGARSYTRALHYATDYAVAARGVEGIIDAWIGRSDAEFETADHGIWLDDAEQARRRFILTLLAREGVTDVPAGLVTAVDRLLAEGLVVRTGGVLTLTDDGVARSDAIGPMLISEAVRERMVAWETR